jgi:hypothetical protein
MGGKRLEVSASTETSNDWVPDLCKPAVATAFNVPRGNEEH